MNEVWLFVAGVAVYALYRSLREPPRSEWQACQSLFAAPKMFKKTPAGWIKRPMTAAERSDWSGFWIW